MPYNIFLIVALLAVLASAMEVETLQTVKSLEQRIGSPEITFVYFGAHKEEFVKNILEPAYNVLYK